MRNIRTLAVALLLTASALLLNSCEKWGDDPIPQTPPTEMVTQTFDLKIGPDISPLVRTKSWDPLATNLDGLLVYSSVPATFTLTGTGSSSGRIYTQQCTVQQLRTGGVSMTILPGTYTATFETPHVRTTDVYSNSPYAGVVTPGSVSIGDVLDIKIHNTGLNLTGSPITLTATLEDALIVVDVPNVAYVFAEKSKPSTIDPNPFLLKNETKGIHYAYVNETPLWLRFTSGTVRNVDCSNFQKGNAYHLISTFGATTVLDIPNMIVNNVIIP